MSVSSLEQLDALVARVKQAQAVFAEFSQQQVDVIFRSAALAAADARIPLARMAVEETGMGVMEDKVIKNHFASEYIYNAYKDDKTCGIVEVNDEAGTITVAEPVGLICGIVPTTNPTSTAIFKAARAVRLPGDQRSTTRFQRLLHSGRSALMTSQSSATAVLRMPFILFCSSAALPLSGAFGLTGL